jgi:hypothetical protein
MLTKVAALSAFASAPLIAATPAMSQLSNSSLANPLWLFAALTALSVGWLRGTRDSTTALYGMLTFSSFPVVFALQIRQPTLF